MTKITEQTRKGVTLVGEALAPFFLQDPQTGEAGDSFLAMATLDVESTAEAWPFIERGKAARDLGMMVDSLADNLGVEAPAETPTFHADDKLTWEYRRLFIGPGKKPCPPWGSVYTDHDCVIFGESTLALRAWMRSCGIARTTDENTPEDHIGLMLALMAWLAQNQASALDEYLRLHLLTWSSHYLDELAQAAEHPFYEGLAYLTKDTLEGIEVDLDLSVVHPRFYR